MYRAIRSWSFFRLPSETEVRPHVFCGPESKKTSPSCLLLAMFATCVPTKGNGRVLIGSPFSVVWFPFLARRDGSFQRICSLYRRAFPLSDGTRFHLKARKTALFNRLMNMRHYHR